MNMYGGFLSQEEKERIHKSSIQILENTGIKFPSERALALLEKGGARIDWDRQIAYISEAMVKQALKTAPKEILIGARNPEYAITIPAGYTTYNLDGTGVNFFDYNKGQKRPAVMKDIAAACRVFQEIPLGTLMWVPVNGSDCPKNAKSIAGIGTAFASTSKHVSDEIKEPEELPYVIEILKAILGSEEEIQKQNIYSITYCTIAPLAHDKAMLEATMDLTRYKVPMTILPMPCTGSTGPASLFSNIAVANAEALSAFTVFQLTNPGTPIIFGTGTGTLNPKNGLFLEGAPEVSIMECSMSQMGKYYGFPTVVGGCITDAVVPGTQAVMEKVLSTMPLAACGVDIVQGIGLVESSMTLSLEQMLIDSEISLLCKRIAEGVRISDETDLMEDIAKVGAEGHFLKQKSTRKAMRSSEFLIPPLSDRITYDEWVALGSKDLYEKAHERVEQILASDLKDPLDHNTKKTIDEIVEAAGRELV